MQEHITIPSVITQRQSLFSHQAKFNEDIVVDKEKTIILDADNEYNDTVLSIQLATNNDQIHIPCDIRNNKKSPNSFFFNFLCFIICCHWADECGEEDCDAIARFCFVLCLITIILLLVFTI